MSTVAHRPPQSHVRTNAGATNGSAYNPRNLYRPHHPAPRTTSTTWRLDTFVDKSSGQSKEIVVLDDTPSPSPSAGPSRVNGLVNNSAVTNGRPAYSDAHAPIAKRAKAINGDAYAGFDTVTPLFTSGENDVKSSVKGKRKLDNYVAGQQLSLQQQSQQICDDKEGHYIVRADDMLFDRYRVIKLLGQGTFGKVVQAVDTKSVIDPRTGKRMEVAVKVIRAVQKYRDASKVEIKVLKLLAERDPRNLNKCIHLLQCFDFRNHICVVTELLSQSVFDFLKDNQYNPFPPSHIQAFAKQLLSSVAFLHDLRLVHTDLKPENILLVDSAARVIPVKTRGSSTNKTRKILKSSEIRLIDFGSATFEDDYHASVVSTRHYRAPEIILGLGWSYPCDVWSIGCILIEFFTGEALFQTHENLEHLAMMDIVFGRMPDTMAKKGSRQKPEWFKGGKLDYPQANTTRQSRKFVKAMKRLDIVIPHSSIINARFRDLLEKLLAWEPSKRITVKEALKHNYFALKIEDEATMPS